MLENNSINQDTRPYSYCPYCGGGRKLEWRKEMYERMLPTVHYHCVFTVPAELNQVFLHDQRAFVSALFWAAIKTIEKFCEKPGVQLGVVAVLHTWGRDLSVHPHVHMICPPGGVDIESLKGGGGVRWKALPHIKDESTGGYFLFPVKAMGDFFRGRFMALLTEEMDIPADVRRQCFEKPWVVFAKDTVTPGRGCETEAERAGAILDYLGRYVYGNAIHEGRMVSVTGERVSFRYKSYKDGGETKVSDLPGEEFVRRFAAHIPPKGFRKVRFYGFWSSTCRETLAALQAAMGVPSVHRKRGRMSTADILRALGKDPGRSRRCVCGGQLYAVRMFPGDWKDIMAAKVGQGGMRDGPKAGLSSAC